MGWDLNDLLLQLANSTWCHKFVSDLTTAELKSYTEYFPSQRASWSKSNYQNTRFHTHINIWMGMQGTEMWSLAPEQSWQDGYTTALAKMAPWINLSTCSLGQVNKQKDAFLPKRDKLSIQGYINTKAIHSTIIGSFCYSAVAHRWERQMGRLYRLQSILHVARSLKLWRKMFLEGSEEGDSVNQAYYQLAQSTA